MKKLCLKFNQNLYSKEAVMKAAYHFIDRCYIHVDCYDNEYVVELVAKNNTAIDSIPYQFENEILAQTVRQIVYKQTHTIREVLLARAMASTITGDSLDDLYCEEQSDADSLEDILMDWFEKNEK